MQVVLWVIVAILLVALAWVAVEIIRNAKHDIQPIAGEELRTGDLVAIDPADGKAYRVRPGIPHVGTAVTYAKAGEKVALNDPT